MKHHSLLLLLPCWLLACAGEPDCRKDQLESIAEERQIPDSAEVNDIVELAITAYAFAQCGQELYVALKKEDTFNYSVQAFGKYACADGICLTALLPKDTIIHFQPTQPGIYRFHVTETPQRTVTDTLVVM